MSAALLDRFPEVDPRDPAAILAAARAAIDGRIVFTTSFGLEDQVITHLIAEAGLAIDIATIDTGRLFAVTYEVWARTEERYGLRIRSAHPDAEGLSALLAAQGVNGLYESVAARKACCDTRKVLPLGRLLAGASAPGTRSPAPRTGRPPGPSPRPEAPRAGGPGGGPSPSRSRAGGLGHARTTGCRPVGRGGQAEPRSPGAPRAGGGLGGGPPGGARRPGPGAGPAAPAGPSGTPSTTSSRSPAAARDRCAGARARCATRPTRSWCTTTPRARCCSSAA